MVYKVKNQFFDEAALIDSKEKRRIYIFTFAAPRILYPPLLDLPLITISPAAKHKRQPSCSREVGESVCDSKFRRAPVLIGNI